MQLFIYQLFLLTSFSPCTLGFKMKLAFIFAFALAMCLAQFVPVQARPYDSSPNEMKDFMEAIKKIGTITGCLKKASVKCLASITGDAPEMDAKLTNEQCCQVQKAQDCIWNALKQETDCMAIFSGEDVEAGKKGSNAFLQAFGCDINSC